MQRIRLTFKALWLAGFFPLIVNKHSLNAVKKGVRLQKYDGIPYVELSYIATRPNNFAIRALNKITGYVNEFFFLFKRRKQIKAAILYTPLFSELFYYRILSKIWGFKLVIQYVEYRSAIDNRQTFFKILNDRLFDGYCHKFCDGVLAISEFLKDHIESKGSKTKVLKAPVICDFNEFSYSGTPVSNQPYLMYCGTINYLEVIEFLLDLFIELKNEGIYNGNFLMVISGDNKPVWDQFRARIAQNPYASSIEVLSNIKYSELVDRYIKSDVLVIPLRRTIQDIARFPHKIGEYTASGRPILSTKLGELDHYFDDNSAILADEYTVESYKQKMKSTLANRDLSTIGKNGYDIGQKKFHYASVAAEIGNFIENL
ncbi:glycosyltransferase [Mucilaginibacter sp. CAU 1740]|uniref:glycosyltransferase n=1 Tax=Mucilaginibacter sp. CAU 1740 TaxID=3140365 RepID=UPI00325B3643